MNRLQKAWQSLTGPTEKAIRNKFNEAFTWTLGGGYASYDTSNPTYVDKGYNHNSIVYSIINQQATKSASIPFTVKMVEDKTSLNKLNRLDSVTKGDYNTQQHVKRSILESKAFKEMDKPFPMEQPNVSQSWVEFIALYKTFLKLTGNVYIYILSPDEGMNAGKPIQVYLLPSHLVEIVVRQDANMLGAESPIRAYMLTYGRSYIEFDCKDVIHIKTPNPNYSENGDHLYGQSPLRAALRNIQSSNSAIDLNIKTLDSGGAYGIITAKTPLTPDQATEIKSRLMEMEASTDKMAKIAGISIPIEFTRLSLSTDELKPFDFLKFDKQQIADVLNWSIEDESRGDFGGTIHQIQKQRITDNIKPDLDLLARALNNEFLPRFKGYEDCIIVFEYANLPEMQEDIKELVEWLDKALASGVINRNEYRLAIKYNESEDDNMNIHTVNTDLMSLEEALDTNFGVE